MGKLRERPEEQTTDAEILRAIRAMHIPGISTDRVIEFYERTRFNAGLSGTHAPLTPQAYALQETVGYLMDLRRASESGLVRGRGALDGAINALGQVARRHNMQIHPEESQLVRGTLAEEVPRRQPRESPGQAPAGLSGATGSPREGEQARPARNERAPSGVGEADRRRLGLPRAPRSVPTPRSHGLGELAAQAEREAAAAEREVALAQREASSREARIAEGRRPAPRRSEVDVRPGPGGPPRGGRGSAQAESERARVRQAQRTSEEAERATREAMRSIGGIEGTLTSLTRRAGRQGRQDSLITEVGDIRVREGEGGSAIRRRTSASESESLGSLGRSSSSGTRGEIGTGTEYGAGPSNLSSDQSARHSRPARMDIEEEARRISAMISRLDSMCVSQAEHDRVARLHARLNSVQNQGEGVTIGSSLDPIQAIIRDRGLTPEQKLSAAEAEVAGIERRFARR